jgi:hypothetical protein
MPFSKALGQLVKGYEIAMSSTILLANENEKLHMENQCQKKKRAKKRTYIAKGGILSEGLLSTSCLNKSSRESSRGSGRTTIACTTQV